MKVTRHIADHLLRVRPISQSDDFKTDYDVATRTEYTRDYVTLCGLDVNDRYIGISDAEPNCPDCLASRKRPSRESV